MQAESTLYIQNLFTNIHKGTLAHNFSKNQVPLTKSLSFTDICMHTYTCTHTHRGKKTEIPRGKKRCCLRKELCLS